MTGPDKPRPIPWTQTMGVSSFRRGDKAINSIVDRLRVKLELEAPRKPESAK